MLFLGDLFLYYHYAHLLHICCSYLICFLIEIEAENYFIAKADRAVKGWNQGKNWTDIRIRRET